MKLAQQIAAPAEAEWGEPRICQRCRFVEPNVVIFWSGLYSAVYLSAELRKMWASWRAAEAFKSSAMFVAASLVTVVAVLALRSSRAESTRPQLERSRTQLLAILVTSSECRAADKATLSETWTLTSAVLAAIAFGRSEEFRRVGVSLDGPPARSVRELMSLGPFDEIAVGGGWTNTASLQYVIREVAGAPAVPQLIVVRRRIEFGGVLTVAPDSLVARVVGVDAIARYAERLQAAPTSPLRPFRED